MRAELPWNVAGIPPEAREAARAAARREGLSVGEWLTRRIIAELGEGAVPASLGEQDSDIVSGAKHSDTEDMLARLSQAEADASQTYRRIEEQLRSVGSGFDDAARSQSESNRTMSLATGKVISARHERAQAFDQLGRHMTGLDERLRKLEHVALHDGMKEAVKGLHQGLSRLADQFGQATAQSCGQVASLARNLEQLALRLVQARADAEAAAQALKAHLAQMEDAHHLTVEQVQEEIESQFEAYGGNLADVRRNSLALQASLAAIEKRVEELEGPGLAVAHRLMAIEQDLSAIREVLAEPDPHAGLPNAFHQIALRLELLEQSHTSMLADLKAGLARIPEEAPHEESFVLSGSELPAPALEDHWGDNALRAEYHPTAEPLAHAVPDNIDQDDFADQFGVPPDITDDLAQSPGNERDYLQSVLPLSAEDAVEAETEQATRTIGWNRPVKARKSRPNYLVILVTLFLLFLAAGALMLNQRFIKANNPFRPIPKHATMANASAVTSVSHRQVAPPPPIASQAATESAAAPVPPPSVDQMLVAANGGNVTAEAIIGLKYLDSGDAGDALPWLKKAAEAGQPVAQFRLGTMYERGLGVNASAALAVKWYLAAAGQGNRKAMHNLAMAYAKGSAGPTNMDEAARWFTKAAQLGLPDSQFNLAVLYERGDGVPQSLIDSYKWYSIAAAQGDADSEARRSVLRIQLSDRDRATAERAAQSFQPQPLSRVANVPPDAGDIGG